MKLLSLLKKCCVKLLSLVKHLEVEKMNASYFGVALRLMMMVLFPLLQSNESSEVTNSFIFTCVI